MPDTRYRLLGLVFLAAAAGTTYLHRQIYETAKNGPAQLGELALGLLTFALASVGILFVMHGGKLLRGIEIKRPAKPIKPKPPRRRTNGETPFGFGEALDSREGVASVLARRALAAASARAAASGAKKKPVDQPPLP